MKTRKERARLTCKNTKFINKTIIFYMHHIGCERMYKSSHILHVLTQYSSQLFPYQHLNATQPLTIFYLHGLVFESSSTWDRALQK